MHGQIMMDGMDAWHNFMIYEIHMSDHISDHDISFNNKLCFKIFKIILI